MQPASSLPSSADESFRLLADAAPVLIWVSGPDNRRTWFNRCWLQFTGRSLEQEQGDGWADGIHPEDREPCRRACAPAFDAHEPFRVEYRLRRHDGAYRWVLDSGAPRFEAAGQFAGYIGSCVDITEQKEAEESARIQQELLRVTLASIGDAVITTDTAGRVTFLNPIAEPLTGWTQPEAEGVPLEQVFRIVNEDTRQTVESPARTCWRRTAMRWSWL